MKLTVLHNELARGLGRVSRLVTSRGQLPVLACVLLEVEKGELRLATTNLELGLSVRIGAKVTETGKMAVPAKSLFEFVESAGGENVILEEEQGKLKVKCEKFSASFAGMSASEFPAVPGYDPKNTASVDIEVKTVEEVAAKVAYAAAVDESRPVLTGVQFKTLEKGLTATATDGFRLARMAVSETKLTGFKDSLILPSRTIIELAGFAGEGEGRKVRMQLAAENNQVVFEAGKTELVTRILEGNYPDVEKIIPAEWTNKMTVDREEMIKAVKAVAIFGRENNNIVKFIIQNSEIRIMGAAGQTGEGEVEVEAESEGEKTDISFNYKYVLDCLGGMKSERVSLKTNGSLAPGVWEEEGNSNLVALIMPVRI